MTTAMSGIETLTPIGGSSGSEEVITANHIEVIEAVISSLDHNQTAMVNRTDKGTLWKFTYGSVEVFVQLTGVTDSDVLTVWSPVLTLPAKDEAKLMRYLLERNCGDTFESSFGILGDQVVVLASRLLEDISPSEISRIMTIVATIADDNDEVLKAEYGA